MADGRKVNPLPGNPRRLASGHPALLALALLAALAIGSPAAAAAEPAEVGWATPVPDPELTPPTLLVKRSPHYPDDARSAGTEGTVVVAARVGRDGRVREVHAEYSIADLDEAAFAAVRSYEFTSPRRLGLESECWMSVPVRFDAALPPGGHLLEPVAINPADNTRRRLFDADVAALQAAPDGMPTDDDVELRERIMVESMALDVLPMPGPAAVNAFREGEAKFAADDPHASRAPSREAWARAARAAPWWPLPYMRLAAASIADFDFGTAKRSLAVVMAGRPNDPEANALLRRARGVEGGSSRREVERQKKGKKN
jgi:TonB family protein